MKKTLYIAAFFAAAISCTKELAPENPAPAPEQELKQVSFTMTGTKTYVDGTDIKWSLKDSVAVFDGVVDTYHIFKPKADQAVGTGLIFEGEVSASATDLQIVYPCSAADSYTEDVLSVIIPTVQTANQTESFGKEANVSVGQATVSGATVSDVTMKNVCSWAKVTISRNDIASVLFTGLDGETISGPASITFDSDGNPVAASKSVPAGSAETLFPNQVTLVQKNESTPIEAGDYYLAVLPGTVSGLRFYFTSTAGMGSLIYSNASTTFTRSKSKPLGTIDNGSNFGWHEVTKVNAQFIKTAALYKTAAEAGLTNRGAEWPFTETVGTSKAPAQLTTLTLTDGGYQFAIDADKYQTGKGGIWTNSNQGFVLGYPKVNFYLQTPVINGSKLVAVSYSGYQDNAGRCYNPTITDADSTVVLGGNRKNDLPGFTLGTWNLSGTAAGIAYRLYVSAAQSKFLDQLNLTYLADEATTKLVLNTTDMVTGDGFADFPSCKAYPVSDETANREGTYTFTQGGTDYSFYFYGVRVTYSTNFALYFGHGASTSDKNNIVMGYTGSYIKLPAVSGKKLTSITIYSAGSNKTYSIYDSAGQTTKLGSKKITTAGTSETIELSGSVTGANCYLFTSSSAKFVITSLVYDE